MTVDGYSYLQDSAEHRAASDRAAAAGEDARPFSRCSSRSACWCLGFTWSNCSSIFSASRPRSGVPRAPLPPRPPLPSPSPDEGLVAPRALPVEGTPASEALRDCAAAETPSLLPSERRSPPGPAGASRRPQLRLTLPTPPLANRGANRADPDHLSAGESGRPDRSRRSTTGSNPRIRRSAFAAIV